jgi:hypothetical protein
MTPEIGEYFFHYTARHDGGGEEEVEHQPNCVFLRVTPPAGWLARHPEGTLASVAVNELRPYSLSPPTQSAIYYTRPEIRSLSRLRIVRLDPVTHLWVRCSPAEVRRMRREKWEDDA